MARMRPSIRLLRLLAVDLLARIDDLLVPVALRAGVAIDGGGGQRGGRLGHGAVRLLAHRLTFHLFSGAAKGPFFFLRWHVVLVFLEEFRAEVLHGLISDLRSDSLRHLHTARLVARLRLVGLVAMVSDETVDLLNDADQVVLLPRQVVLQFLERLHHPAELPVLLLILRFFQAVTLLILRIMLRLIAV